MTKKGMGSKNLPAFESQLHCWIAVSVFPSLKRDSSRIIELYFIGYYE